MNADTDTHSTLTTQQARLLSDATKKIAPSWPLDKLIAVNPLWSLVDRPFSTVASELSALAGIKTYLPLKSYLAWFKEGRVRPEQLQKAANHFGLDATLESLLKHASQLVKTPDPWRNIADLADQQRPSNKMSWHDEITHQVSQFCAVHYQEQSPTLGKKHINTDKNLYTRWLTITKEDRGLSIIMGESNLSRFFHDLPNTTTKLFALVIQELALDNTSLSFYAHALLLDINGWSSYSAYLNWPGVNEDESLKQDSPLESLLAIKMAWELVIYRYLKHTFSTLFMDVEKKWGHQKHTIPTLIAAHDKFLVTNKVWALALEYSEQHLFHQTLMSPPPKKDNTTPELHAIFCIDVRSEVFRRALEQQSIKIQTLGFAGFFGLPIKYQAKDSQFSRPQLPGLLQATITVTEHESNAYHTHHEQKEARWQRWGHTAPATFSMVESMGWWYAFKILKQTIFPKRQEHPANRLAPNTRWQLTQQNVALTDQEKATLAKGILDTIGLKQYALTVMLVGHGSHTSNNLHAAGLDCGACGGQSGEVNVKVLAELLNDKKVRTLLNHMDAKISDATQFIAALHNTTTDEVTFFSDKKNSPKVDQKLTHWFEQATYLAQKERAVKLDSSLLNLSDKERFNAFVKRANDWSQVSPEWGLANNHSLVIAPRHHTRHMDLQGRSFLHDYDYQDDDDFSVLEKLLTAPMLVAHWINMQYNMSVTDNFKFGSGNKVLHNAVGGNIGVFEGNGGDLRIGLSMQSLSDGKNWMHTPTRLAVYVAAPKSAIEHIANKHDIVKQLIDNDWLYLFQWENNKIEGFHRQQWTVAK